MSEDNSNTNERPPMQGSEQDIIEMLKRNYLDGTHNRPSNRHAFWDTQPMPHTGVQVEGPIEPDKAAEEIRQEPYSMPPGFVWASLNVDESDQLQELYDLLANNYVEDDDALFRFDYSKEFLKWALTPPGYKLDFLLAVRAEKSGKLIAFISAIPATVQVHEKPPVNMVEINFLCAVYTAGVVLPVPVASARYHHRSLNPKKLVSVGFSRLAPRMTLARLAKLYKLPTETATVGLMPMEERHVPAVTTLLTTYLKKFKLRVIFSEDDVGHWLLPRAKVIDSFVVENDKGVVTDLCSYYHLPSTILGRDDTLFAAYSYYNIATSVSWIDLMKDCLVLAKKEGADVFNALNLMDNDEFLKELKFGLGDGNLQYYLYNWACPTMESKEIGIVLL
ncbi:hypothetical protein MHU86_6651 [Fragilaria crotonensis]|nr:hypothetical protein MHU86_6651 [Fragilaria crotonensis]